MLSYFLISHVQVFICLKIWVVYRFTSESQKYVNTTYIAFFFKENDG